MKTSTIFFLLLSSFLAVLPVRIANTCSWGYDDDENILSPFNQQMIEMPEFYPFLFSDHYWKGGETDWSSNSKTYSEEIFDSKYANVNDWVKYFNNSISKEAIEAVIYDTAPEDYKKFEKYITENAAIANGWKQNELIKYWKMGNDISSFKYMHFAKKVESLVSGYEYWEEGRRDKKLLSDVAIDAEQKAIATKDPLLKLRYSYQAMRAAHYSGDYKKCLNLFDELIGEKKGDQTLIYYWCLSLRAGGYWRLNQFVESSYYNSIVFDKCLSRRLYSERDFWIDSETTWQKCLSMCKNDHEKNILWLLTGINQNNSAIPALNEMLQLEASSKEIELLLAREVEKFQRKYMPARWTDDFDDHTIDEVYEPLVKSRLNEMLDFINKGISVNKMHEPSFWYNSAAFLYYLQKDGYKCEEFCKKAIAGAKDSESMLTQARIISILNKIESAGKINSEIESDILEDLKWLNITKPDNQFEFGNPFKLDANRLVMYRLMKYYLVADKPVQAEMCRAKAVEYYNIYQEPEKAPVDALYNFFTNINKSSFDQFLAEQYPYNADDMLEIKGTLLMRENRWKEAIGIFSKMANKEHEQMKLLADPFLIHINDCHDCDFAVNSTGFTKLSLCQKIVELEQKLKKQPKNISEIYHLLANAYYNMSYWGNSWMALDYNRCHGCETNSVEIDDPYFWYYNDFYDLKQSTTYYELAINNAKDKEFAALNYFMLAKSDQIEYYMSDDFEYENTNGLKQKYQTSFATLIEKYKGTEFYAQTINECKYFDYYVKRH